MLNSLREILYDNIRHIPMTVALARANERKKHKGSDLGFIWTFAKPLLYVCVFYFAISMGFKNSKDMEGLVCPYFIWMTTGIIAWFYISAMISDGADCFKKYKYLVNRTVYPVSSIPAIPTVSNLLIHGVMVIFLLVLAMFSKTPPSIYWLQLPIYMALMVLLAFMWATAIGLICALSRDIRDLIRAIQPAFFWLSGILFDCRSAIDSIWAHWFFKLNPITYIVQGYRNSICFHIWIWEQPQEFLCFIIDLAILLFFALWLHARLRRSLPDFL